MVMSNTLYTIPVVDVLSYYGKRVDHVGYMYYSPFREEATPSMRITQRGDGTWLWADYGGTPAPGRKADGGGCYELVRRLSGLSSKKAVFDELRRIAESRGVVPVETAGTVPERRPRRRTPSTIVVDGVPGPFTNRVLMGYAASVRGIPFPILDRYCREVSYHTVTRPGRRYFAIGFPNDEGGWVLRGASKGSGKHVTVSGVSTFGPDGSVRRDGDTPFERGLMFEGFMDFLSFLAWKGVTEPGADVCVLNSTANVSRSKEWVLAHPKVRTFFDNDASGDQATSEVEGWCREAGLDFRDGRGAYPGVNDLNDAWTAELERRRVRERSCGVRR